MKTLKNCFTSLIMPEWDGAIKSNIRIIIQLTILSYPVITSAQDSRWEWAKTMSGPNIESGKSIAIDKHGNIYTLGNFLNTVDFDPGPDVFNLTSKAMGDIFITKLDRAGQFLWAKVIGSHSIDISKSLVVDTFGNIYIIGEFNSNIDVDPGPEAFYLAGAGHLDVFVCKLNSDGEFKWAKSIGGSEKDSGGDIYVDASGSIYITGGFKDTCVFGTDEGTFTTSKYLPDIFIAKLDNEGSFQWIKVIGGENEYEEGTTIAVDDFGNVYTSGYFNLPVDFDPSPDTFILEALGGYTYSAFVSKLSPSGNFIWAKSMGGPDTYCSAHDLALDASGNVYVTGDFYGGEWGLTVIDFDPGAGGFYITVPPVADIFIVKLSASGDFDWAKQIGNEGWDSANAFAVDDTGSVYITGQFSETVDFDPSNQTFWLSSAGAADIFISKFDREGRFIWASGAGGSNNDNGSSLALDADGYVYVTGGFESENIRIDTFVLHNQAVADKPDAFIIKLNTTEEKCQVKATPFVTDVLCHGDSTGAVSIHVYHAGDPITYHWSDGETSATNSRLRAGNYAVTFSDANACEGLLSFTISESPQMDTELNAVSPASESGAGRIWITVTGGTGEYSYHWIDPLGTELFTEDLDNLTVSGYYNLTVTDENGCTNTLDPIFVDQVSATSPFVENPTVHIYPVPAKDMVIIDTEKTVAEVLIIGVDGRVYQHIIRPASNRLDVAELGAGWYSLKISDGTNWYNARIVK